MPHLDADQLSRVVVQIPDHSALTPAERAEVLRIAQGLQCKDSAAAASVSPETIRARRKRIYHKLHVAGSGELISAILALSLRMLCSSGTGTVPAQTQPGPSPAGDD